MSENGYDTRTTWNISTEMEVSTSSRLGFMSPNAESDGETDSSVL